VVIKREAADTFDRIARVLERGGVVIMMCDTIYGIVGTSPHCDRRIARIKARKTGRPFLKLIADAGWIERFTDEKLPGALERYWPGPLTVIFRARDGGTVALRVPADGLLRNLLRRLEKPLISTSVNRSGEAAHSLLQAIVSEFESEVDLIVDSGNQQDPVPSTVLDLTVKPCRVVRRGAAEIPPEILSSLTT